MKNISTSSLFTLSCALLAASTVQAQSSEAIKAGLMLPYTGTFAQLGVAIENGFKLFVQEQGGALTGKKIALCKVDDESEPSKAIENANKLVQLDEVDVLVGTVRSGVAIGMAKVAKDTKTLLIIPNAGADAITGPLFAPDIFRTSFTIWQPACAMGLVAAERKNKNAVTITWKYAAGQESVKGYMEGFESKEGKVTNELSVPFPAVEFQALLAEIAAAKTDAVNAFFAGSGAVKFVKDFAAAGRTGKIRLYGAGFLTDGPLEAQGDAATGLLTTLHYADGLDTPKDRSFRLSYAKTYKLQPDVYAVQGYDAAQMLAAELKAAGGDFSKREVLIKGMEQAKIDSPRGAFTPSKAHNPVQDIYLRKVENKENKMVSIAAKGLADPVRGGRM